MHTNLPPKMKPATRQLACNCFAVRQAARHVDERAREIVGHAGDQPALDGDAVTAGGALPRRPGVPRITQTAGATGVWVLSFRARNPPRFPSHDTVPERQPTMRMRFLVPLAFALAACGGGGGGPKIDASSPDKMQTSVAEIRTTDMSPPWVAVSSSSAVLPIPASPRSTSRPLCPSRAAASTCASRCCSRSRPTSMR